LGDTTKKVIYLTFDEGYENGYTSKILDVLRDNNVKAVFFITGPYLNEHEDLVRRMVEEVMWWEITRYIIQPSEPFRQRT